MSNLVLWAFLEGTIYAIFIFHATCPADIYLFKVNKRNSRKRCEICLKLTKKTPEWRQKRVFFVCFEHVFASWVKTFQQYILLSLEAFCHIPPTLRFAINYTYKKVSILVIFTGARFMLNMIEEFMLSRSFKKVVQCLEKHLFILKFFRKKVSPTWTSAIPLSIPKVS